MVSLQYMDRMLGLDTNNKTVMVEPGMKLFTPYSLLGTINRSMDCLAVGGPCLGWGKTGLGSPDPVGEVEAVNAKGKWPAVTWTPTPGRWEGWWGTQAC